MSKSTFLISTLAALATTGALLSGPILAATEDSTAPVVVSAKAELPNRADWMTLKQVHQTLEKAGYKDESIKGINTTRQGYMVKTLNSEDKKTYLMVHPTDGTITTVENRKSKHKGKGENRKHGKGHHCNG